MFQKKLAAAAIPRHFQMHRFASFELQMMPPYTLEWSHQGASARTTISDRRSKLADVNPLKYKKVLNGHTPPGI
jgi:hypothetical protein